MERISSSHSYGESSLHLQFTPKKRKKAFLDSKVREECRRCFLEVARELGVVLHAAEFGPDHVHIFFSRYKRYAIPYLAQRFKGASSRRLRKHLGTNIAKYLIAKAFWSGGYFYETVGSVTARARKFYIERCQQKHWKGFDYPINADDQTQLGNWFN